MVVIFWKFVICFIGIRAVNFLGGAKEILPKFLQICLNNFYSTKVLRKTFLLLLVHCVILYHATIDLIEHLVFEIWFLKLPN